MFSSFLRLFVFVYSWMIFLSCADKTEHKIFDVHLHGEADPVKQLEELQTNGVGVIAVSTSWPQQQQYLSSEKLKILHGLMIPCPNGKVPYSLQTCFEDGKEWPEPAWVENQIKEKRIDFIGEVLAQYYGISESDSSMYPYYALAEKYDLPVGIHTGSAGPNHGSPNFKEELGNPLLARNLLESFPKLRVWLMHGGGPYIKECLEMLKTYPGLCIDISVLNDPRIVSQDEFAKIMKLFIDNGMEDRLFFGSDNAPISTTIASVNKMEFLSESQKRKVLAGNAEKFFKIK